MDYRGDGILRAAAFAARTVDGTRANWFKKLMDEYVHPARIVRRRDNVN
jgi:hypothetical protein